MVAASRAWYVPVMVKEFLEDNKNCLKLIKTREMEYIFQEMIKAERTYPRDPL